MFVFHHHIPTAHVIALHIELVAEVIASGARHNGTEKTLEIGWHFQAFGKHAVFIRVPRAGKLRCRLCADGNHHGLVGARAQVHLLIVKPVAGGEEIVVVIIMIFEPITIGKALITDFATNL